MEKRMVFPDLIGNERIRSLFADALKREGAAHAYVLEGPRGSGRHTAARQIAAASLCENRRDPSYPLPCGRCASCRKVLGGKSVDVMTVSRGDRATLGVEAVRAVRDSLWVTPNDGEKKFYIIEDAHLMTQQAQNALLLSLEEPPEYVTFLLLAEDASLLLETVRSRAPVLRMERFSPSFTEDWLARQCKNADRDRIVKAAHLSGGALGMAKLLCDGGGAELGRYESAAETVRLLLQGRRSEAAAFIPSLPTSFQVSEQYAEFYSGRDGVPAWAKKISVRRAVSLSARLAEAEDGLAANLSINTVMAALFSGTSALQGSRNQ